MPQDEHKSLTLKELRSSLEGKKIIPLKKSNLDEAFEKDAEAVVFFKSSKLDGSIFVAKFKDLAYYFQFEKFSDELYVQTETLGMRRHPGEETKIRKLIEADQVYMSDTLLKELDALIERHQAIQDNVLPGEDLMMAVLASGKQSKTMFDKERVFIIQSKDNPHLFEINWMEDHKLVKAKMFYNPKTKSFHSEQMDFLKKAIEAKKLVVDVSFKDAIEKLIGTAVATLRLEGK